MKKIYLKPSAEFEEIEETVLFQPSVESQSVAKEAAGQSQGPSSGEEIGDNPPGGFDW